MMNASPSYTVNELESCMHICCFYETEEEHQNLLTTFIKKGVERGEKILSIVDAHTLKRFQEFLLDNATKVKTYIDTGQLNLVTIDETYTRNGLFDAEKIIGLLRNETEFAIAGGYTGLRVIKEMGGALKRMKNFDRLIEYETKLNTFFPNSNCFIICQYNRNSIDSKLLLDVLASHPLVMIDNEIYDNFSYLTPTKVLEQDRSTINLYNNRLENLTVRKRAEEASQITSKQMEITFNANNNGICSADKCKKILRYNEAIPNHLNKSEDGLVGRTCFVHLLSTSESIDGYPIVHKRETHQREVLNFNFNERLLNVLFNPIFNNNGNINSKVHSISDSTDHKRTEEKEKQDINSIKYLSKTAIDFIEFPFNKDIYKYIGEHLKKLVGDSIVIVNSFDPKSDFTCVRSIVGLGKLSSTVLRILGRSPVGMTYKINEIARRQLLTGKYHKLPGKMFELTFGQMPKPICHVLEKLFGICEIHSMGFTWRGELLGNVVIIVREHTHLKNRNVIKMFINQAAVALQRKQAEEALRESEAQFRTFAENVSSVVNIYDIYPDGRRLLIYINQKIKELLGGATAKKINNNFDIFFELIHPKDLAALKKATDDAQASSQPLDHEYRIRSIDTNKYIWVRSTGFLSVRENGIVRWHGHLTDITERKHAEEQIKLRLEFEKTISKISSRFIGVSDINNEINVSLADLGKMSGASRTYLFIFKEDGLTMDNTHEWCAEGVNPQIDNLQNIRTDMVPWWMKKLKKGEIIHIEDVSKLPKSAQAEKKILEAQDIKSILVLPLYIKNKLTGFIGFDNVIKIGKWREVDLALLRTSSDIIGRALEFYQIEQELQKYQEHLKELVEERTSELESFAFSVSHDLRAPLRAMQGFAQILLEDYGDKLDKEGKDYANRIAASSQHLIDIIQELLIYSRLSRVELQLEPVSLEIVVNKALKDLEVEINEKDAKIKVEDTLPVVIGHTTTLIKVITNLLLNAITFVKPNVKPKVKIWTQEHNNKIRLYFEDNGIGIAPEYQSQIFKIFERLHGCETFAGTGIGLAIVKKGIERLGGKVGVESAFGKGSTFWLELDKGGLKNDN